MVVVPATPKRLTVNNVQKYFNNVNLEKSKLLSLGYSLENINREYLKNRKYDNALQRLKAAHVAAPVPTPKRTSGTKKLANLVREERERQKSANEAAARNLQIKQDAKDAAQLNQEQKDAIAAREQQEKEDAALAAALAKE